MSSAIPSSQLEFDFLCLLASTEFTAGRLERLGNWDLSTLDWNRVQRLAEHHGVLPLISRNLLEHARGIPPPIELSLRSDHEANLRRGLWFASEMARIVGHFHQRRQRAVPYKGPLLAQMVYKDVALRKFSDLDFLISPQDFESAKLALIEIGYRPSADLSPALERFWLRNGYERSFDCAAGKNLVELQWALMPRFNAIRLPVEDLLARAVSTVLDAREVPCLSAEDSLLVLCLHAAKHLWTRLIWLVDIAETMRSQTIDYEQLLSRARFLGVARIVGVNFWLVKNVLRRTLPQPAEAMMLEDGAVPSLGRASTDRIVRGSTYDFESTEYFRLSLKLREGRTDRLRYLWRLVWTPGVGDFAAVPLPEFLFPLYRIVRMGRLMGKIIRGAG